MKFGLTEHPFLHFTCADGSFSLRCAGKSYIVADSVDYKDSCLRKRGDYSSADGSQTNAK